MEIQETAALSEVCKQCETVLKPEHTYCPGCGYPQRGTAGEKSKFHANRVMIRSKARQAPAIIRQARNILFFIAGITFLYGSFLFYSQDDMAGLIGTAVMTVIYMLLAFWSQKKPLIALVLAVLLYATNMVISAIEEPDTLFQGLIMKGIIIYFLAKGINSAMHLRKLHL